MVVVGACPDLSEKPSRVCGMRDSGAASRVSMGAWEAAMDGCNAIEVKLEKLFIGDACEGIGRDIVWRYL